MKIEDLSNKKDIISIIDTEVGDCFMLENDQTAIYMRSDFDFDDIEYEYTIPVIELNTGKSNILKNDIGVILLNVKLQILGKVML